MHLKICKLSSINHYLQHDITYFRDDQPQFLKRFSIADWLSAQPDYVVQQPQKNLEAENLSVIIDATENFQVASQGVKLMADISEIRTGQNVIAQCYS